jgi:hypothetical protein
MVSLHERILAPQDILYGMQLINLLKPTGDFTYHRVLIVLSHCIYVFCMDLRTNFSLYNSNRMDLVTEVESVYCAVRTESLCNTDMFRL